MYKVITFDIYSASLDIIGSAVPIVEKVLNKNEAFCHDFFVTWRKQQWNFLLLNNSMNDTYKSYQYITEQALDYTCKKNNIRLNNKEFDSLMRIWTTFSLWPEARHVINTLKDRGYKVAMLSNGDESMLSQLQECIDLEFDYLFSGDQAKCYKPHKDIYLNVFKKLDIDLEDHIHVAGSMFDVMGAKAAGINCIWSNRLDEKILDERFSPDHEIDSLDRLLDILPVMNEEV